MSNKKNKVKYNLRNVHYALLKTNTAEGMTFDTPVPIAGAVSMSFSPSGDLSNFYADGYAYYTISNNAGYEGDLELALIPENFLVDVLKEELDNNNVLIEKADIETQNFALLFEFDGDVKKIRHVMYCCSATRPSVESSTKEESIEVTTETLTISATSLACGIVKAKTGDSVSDLAYQNWYSSVYIPDTTNTEVSEEDYGD